MVRPFDKIFETVARDEAEAGVLIHEGQLTYEKEGFHKVEDFGERWERETGLPLPLGLDVVRKDLGRDLAREINGALRESIEWAYENEDEALTYALQFGRGLQRELGRRFVKMYVSDLTKDMGSGGREGPRGALLAGASGGNRSQRARNRADSLSERSELEGGSVCEGAWRETGPGGPDPPSVSEGRAREERARIKYC